MTGPPPRPRIGMPWAALIDVAAVVGFAALGRASHAEDNPVLGALSTAWPFLIGLALGWAMVRWRSRRWPLTLGPGIPVWLGTVAVGMVLRALTGQGTAFSFVLVATLVTGALLLGWRLAAGKVLDRP